METADAVKLNEWQHVTVTYDGKRLARGVKIYVNGESKPVKILFDQNTEPFHKKNTPIRVGAGGGLRFKGSIGDARIYNRALSPGEAAALSVAEPMKSIPATGRTKAQQAKLDLAFLETAAPKDVRAARIQLTSLETERDRFYDSLPTVMVMADGANRDNFLLKRGAYDSPGDKVTAGVPQVLPQLRPELPR